MNGSNVSDMFLIFLINVFASTLLILQCQAGSDAAQAPMLPLDQQHAAEPGKILVVDPRSALPQYRDFVEACHRRVNRACAREIMDHLRNDDDKGTVVGEACCGMILSAGPDCYHTMHVTERRFPISVARRTDFAARREKLWARCEMMNLPAAVAGDFPRLPAKGLLPVGENPFVDVCAAKLTPKCGHEIVMALTGKRKEIDEDCCGMLAVRMGKSCHDEMVRMLIDDVEGQMKAVVAGNSKMVWEYCQSIFG